MLNRDIYLKDPATRKLANEGVANVNDERTKEALDVLRYELETFVCDGQYEKGLEHILSTYLKNIDQAQQPAVWVSGFYGSGKSHLVKMLRALWVDTVLPDGATARSLSQLPPGVSDLLKELTTEGKRHGGLHAASGTLGAGAYGSVRLALLRVFFKSVDLPIQYPVAKFVLWLKHEKIYDAVRFQVEQNGLDWQDELDNFYVAEGLHEALAKAKPNLFPSAGVCAETLSNMYPYAPDVSSDEMVKTIRQALTKEGKFPLTLIVLDEVQQYIGGSAERSIEVQEAVETCCQNFAGKLMFIGTGQTAVTGTANLARLQGRFTVRIELSDTDVDAVIRKVILAKKPSAVDTIEKEMQTNLGEISRHLTGTIIAHRQDDIAGFAQDYPILPVRRRFWENTLRVLDQTGTDSQLRNQLSMAHKVIQSNLDQTLGHVIPADHLFFDSADKLLQARILPRKVYEQTRIWLKGTSEERLMARACGLVFLVNKLAGSNNEIGIKADIDTLADLLVEDLSKGSAGLRSQLPQLLDKCDILMKVGAEYRIQTEESAAWNDEYLMQFGQLANEAHRIESEREDRIKARFSELVKKASLTQGSSKVARDFSLVFDAQLPADSDKRICVWVRNGWIIDENSVRAEALKAGNQSPTVFVFIPKRSADDLRNALIQHKSAAATLDKRGVPNTPEGTEAKASMETTKQSAEAKIKGLLDEAFSGAKVFQSGGNELVGNDLQSMVIEGANLSLARLYPQFGTADHSGWSTVYSKAQQGAPDALKAVGDTGEPANNPVCKALLAFVGAGKKGADIRKQFESAPYGWPGDAVDGGLQVLLVGGLLRAQDDMGKVLDPKALERKAITKTTYKVESTTITTQQRIAIRQLMVKGGVQVKSGEESISAPLLLQKLDDLANQAGGEAPKPAQPDTTLLETIRLSAGNDQLLAIFNGRDELGQAIDDWSNQAKLINGRLPSWQQLKKLAEYLNGIADAEIYLSQINQIEEHRRLLYEPDAIAPLVSQLTQLLREQLNVMDAQYDSQHKAGMARLAQDANWQKLEPEQKNELLSAQSLTLVHRPKVSVATTSDVLATLAHITLSMFSDRLAAMSGRFDTVLREAALIFEPQIQYVHVPKRCLKTEEDIAEWLKDAEIKLKTALTQGPVMPS